MTILRSLTLLALAVALPAAAATVTSVSPSSDVLAGGATVVITGTGFNDGTVPTAVTIDGVAVTSFSVDSATRITAVVPAGGSIGKKVIVVTDAGGDGTSGAIFTYKTSVKNPLVINVTATLLRVISLIWTGNTVVAATPIVEGSTADLTWPLGNVTPSQAKSSIDVANDPSQGVNGYDFEVRNAGNSPVVLTGTMAVDPAAAPWTAGAAVGSDVYYMGIATGSLNPAPVVTWTSLDAGPVLSASLAVDGVVPFELRFQTPSSATGASYNILHTLTVTLTATAAP